MKARKKLRAARARAHWESRSQDRAARRAKAEETRAKREAAVRKAFETKSDRAQEVLLKYDILGGYGATILKKAPKARIVMCSALGQEALVIESIAAGAKDFIVKPFSAEKVLKVFDSVIAE